MKRQITSLVLFLSTLIMAITGVVMFAMPGHGPGSGGSHFLGLDKGQHKELHVVFMIPLVIAALLHAVWNLGPLVSYLKLRSSTRKHQALGMAVAIAIVLLFAGGTLARMEPFTRFVQLGHRLSHGDDGPGRFPGAPPAANGPTADAMASGVGAD
ncbi:MAG TPA: DUF4405 domain-containing protein [Armatimonadota bacterium]|nr:DUF4405 domain-containing protein [Armatimonadota bacterium]HQK92077.1 DUF4405 domain-containing protein [Armatimonadota bacterium]